MSPVACCCRCGWTQLHSLLLLPTLPTLTQPLHLPGCSCLVPDLYKGKIGVDKEEVGGQTGVGKASSHTQ